MPFPAASIGLPESRLGTLRLLLRRTASPLADGVAAWALKEVDGQPSSGSSSQPWLPGWSLAGVYKLWEGLCGSSPRRAIHSAPILLKNKGLSQTVRQTNCVFLCFHMYDLIEQLPECIPVAVARPEDAASLSPVIIGIVRIMFPSPVA